MSVVAYVIALELLCLSSPTSSHTSSYVYRHLRHCTRAPNNVYRHPHHHTRAPMSIVTHIIAHELSRLFHFVDSTLEFVLICEVNIYVQSRHACMD